MAIFNLGSINVDHFYQVPHLPEPGETVVSDDYTYGLGGKGANQSVAAACGGAKVVHIGAIGANAKWTREKLESFGIESDHIATLDMPTAHAVIYVDMVGENAIVISGGANLAQDEALITIALDDSVAGDFCLLQNETNKVAFTAELAKEKGLRVVYSAAPFDAAKTAQILPFIDILVLNEIEARQLADALGVTAAHLPVAEVLVTKGARGAEFRSGGQEISVPAFAVEPVDTTGAGDTYLGFFIAGLDASMDAKGAMTFAAAAAALQVTRQGTTEAIPSLKDVKEFLEARLSS